MSGHEFALADAKDGDWVVVTGTSDEDVTMQTLRFGIAEGSIIQIQKNIPRGPVIISKKHVEIAIGRELAKCVSVMSQPNR